MWVSTDHVKFVRGTTRGTIVETEASFIIFSSVRAARIIIRVTLLLNQPLKMNSLGSPETEDVWNINESYPSREIQTNSKRRRGIHNANVTTAVFPRRRIVFFFFHVWRARRDIGKYNGGFLRRKAMDSSANLDVKAPFTGRAHGWPSRSRTLPHRLSFIMTRCIRIISE